MPAPYDYSGASGYTRARSDWADFPSTTTPILQSHLDKVEQALFDKKAEIYNVGDYGVLPGNSAATNDTNLAALLAATTTGGVIQFNVGDYSFNTSQTLPRVSQKALIIRGMGMGATKLTFTGTGHLFVIGGTSNGDAAYGQWVEDMTIQCTFVSLSIVGAVKFQAATWCGLRRLRINGANLGSQILVDFDGGSYFQFFNTVEGCDFRGIDQPSDIGVRLRATTADGANANWIRRNYFSTFLYAVRVASGDENWTMENHFNGAVTTAVRIDSSGTGNANGNLVYDNHFDGPTNAVDIQSGGVDTHVRGNYGTAAYLNAGANTIVGVNTPNTWTGAGSYVDYQTVASAATIAIPANARTCTITGTTNITSITAKRAGEIVTLEFQGILTFTDGSNLKLNGNFVTSADDTITLVCDGTNWYEMSRSAN